MVPTGSATVSYSLVLIKTQAINLKLWSCDPPSTNVQTVIDGIRQFAHECRNKTNETKYERHGLTVVTVTVRNRLWMRKKLQISQCLLVSSVISLQSKVSSMKTWCNLSWSPCPMHFQRLSSSTGINRFHHDILPHTDKQFWKLQFRDIYSTTDFKYATYFYTC